MVKGSVDLTIPVTTVLSSTNSVLFGETKYPEARKFSVLVPAFSLVSNTKTTTKLEFFASIQ